MLVTEGAKKAAVLLMLLGKDKAESLLQNFGEGEIAQISDAMNQVGSLSKSDAVTVMNDYLTRVEELALPGDGIGFGASLLNNRQTQGVQVDALDMLSTLPTEKVVEILEHEHEQVIAVILAYFDAEHAADCLLKFEKTLRDELVLRISALTNLQPQLLEEINASLGSVVSDVATNNVAFSGAEKMADIIMNMPRDEERNVMNSLDNSPDMKDKVCQYFLSFEECSQYSAREMLIILKDFDREKLAMACAKEPEEIIENFVKSMSSRAQAAFKDELVLIAAEASTESIELAQRDFIFHVKNLLNSKKITRKGK